MSNDYRSNSGYEEKDFGGVQGFSESAALTSTKHASDLDSADPHDEHLDHNTQPDHALKKIRTAGSISISPELFEKLYLSPQAPVHGDLRKTFGNPTPL